VERARFGVDLLEHDELRRKLQFPNEQ